MRRLLVLMMVVSVSTCILQAQDQIVRIDEQVVVDASLDQVWQALTTAEGLAGWMGESAVVELKIGGRFAIRQHVTPEQMEKFKDAVNAETQPVRITSFVPNRMLAYSGGMAGTWNVWLLDEIEPGRIRVQHTGLGTTPIWAKMAPLFQEAMEEIIKKLPVYLKSKKGQRVP